MDEHMHVLFRRATSAQNLELQEWSAKVIVILESVIHSNVRVYYVLFVQVKSMQFNIVKLFHSQIRQKIARLANILAYFVFLHERLGTVFDMNDIKCGFSAD